MANENDIPLNITADTSEASKQLAAFAKTLESSFKSFNDVVSKNLQQPLQDVAANTKTATSQISSFFTGLKTAAAAAIAVIAGREVIQFLSESISEASEAEKAIAQLNAALEATGDATDVGTLQDFADEIQNLTVYSEDAAIQSLILGKNFGLSSERAKELTSAAVELAAKTGTDLTTATEALLQSLNGNTRGLAKLGPEFKNMGEEAAKAGGAIKKINNDFKGTAEALTNTFSGAVLQAQNQFANLQQEFGKLITESPEIIKGIKAFSEAISELTEFVKQNPEIFRELIKSATQLAAFFGKTLVVVLGNVAFAFADVSITVVDAYNAIAGGIKATLGILGEFEAAVIGIIPGLGKLAKEHKQAAQAIGVEGAKQFEKGTTSASDYSKSTLKALDAIKALTEKGAGAFDALASGEGTLKKVSNQTKSTGEDFQALSKDLVKLKDDAIKFLEDVRKRGASEESRIKLIRDEEIQKVEKFLQAGVINYRQAEDARVNIIAEFNKKASELRQKEADDAAKKAAEAAKKIQESIKEASSTPFEFVIKSLKIDDGALSDTKNQIALSLGVVTSILGGKEGAKEFVATAAGAIGDAVLPGIGPVVKELTKTLALGPEAVKELVRGFVDELPIIFENIGKAAPAFVEALVDSLVNKGGAAKIAIAIARAMAGEAAIKSVGKQIALSFKAEASGALEGSFNRFFKNLREEIQRAAVNFSETIRTAFTDVFGGLDVAFANGAQALFNGISGAFAAIQLPQISIPEPAWLERLREILGPPDWLNRLRDLLDTPPWVDAIIDFFRNFEIKLPSLPGGAGGGGGIIPDNVPVIGRFATGGLVPPGYPNDSFIAGLTSGELVIPSDSVSRLQSSSQSGVGGADLAVISALLGQMVTLLKNPVTVETTASVSGQALADIILKLSRNNARLAA